MAKVIHLLPYDGIGGAEAAARSMSEGSCDGLDFQVRFLFPNVQSSRQRLQTYNPLTLLAGVRGILRDNPDLLIVSLWRSCIAGILIRLIRPRVKLVVLIHNSVDAHWLDFLFTRGAMALSDAIWADSEASMRIRFPRKRRHFTVIPFVVRRLEPLHDPEMVVSATPTFVYWGRLARQKNLQRALKLFQQIWKVRPESRFTVIGPDGSELATLQRLSVDLGLTTAVRFVGEMEFDSIKAQARDCAFYLQTSDYEGMAMSVVEAMQLGLVPVVTAVGEIARYCRQGENAVIVESDGHAADVILKLIDDPTAYTEVRRKAILAWQDQPLYRDAVIAECLRLVSH